MARAAADTGESETSMAYLCMTTREGVAIDDGDDEAKSILLVDDEESFLFSLSRRVRKLLAGYHVYTASNGMQARAILSTVLIDLVISDLSMPVMDGVELGLWLAEARPQVPAIFLSSSPEPEMIASLQGHGFRFLQKPVDFQDLARTMRPLLGTNGAAYAQMMHERSFVD
jgi:DNA-binding NtrC family response regulator